MVDKVSAEYVITSRGALSHPAAPETVAPIIVEKIRYVPFSASSGCMPKYSISFAHNVPRHFFTLRVLSSKDNVVKGVLLDGEYITYEFLVSRVVINASEDRKSIIAESRHATNKLAVYRVEKRTSDLKKLSAYLTKNFNGCIVPPLPSRQPFDSKDSTTEFRKRNYTLWLEFVCNNGFMQNDSELIGVLSGTNIPSSEWPDSFEGDEATMKAAIAESTRFLEVYPKSLPPKPPGSQSLDLRVLHDFHTIRREVKRLSSDFDILGDSLRRVVNRMGKMSSSVRDMQLNLMSFEDCGHSEVAMARFLAPALTMRSETVRQEVQLLTVNIVEPVTVLYESTLPVAADLLEKSAKLLTIQSASKRSNAKPESRNEPVERDEEDQSSSAVPINDETYRPALEFIRSYDYCSKFRGYVLLKKAKELASCMAQEVIIVGYRDLSLH